MTERKLERIEMPLDKVTKPFPKQVPSAVTESESLSGRPYYDCKVKMEDNTPVERRVNVNELMNAFIENPETELFTKVGGGKAVEGDMVVLNEKKPIGRNKARVILV